MCLVVKSDYVLQTATEDLPIYKLVEKKFGNKNLFQTIYYSSTVKLNKKYRSKISVENWGQHLCEVDVNLCLQYPYSKRKYVQLGLHAFWGGITKSLLRDYLNNISDIAYVEESNKVLLGGYIPKGAKYILNEDTGLVAASTMVHNEVLDIRNFLI